MKIINNTKWDTRDLRKLCLAVLKQEGASKHTVIYINTKTKRGCDYHGRATINGFRITMFVPPTMRRKWACERDEKRSYGSDGKPFKVNTLVKFDIEDFSQVLTHEIGHNLGLTHREMDRIGNLNVDYTQSFQVNPQVIKPKQKRNLVDERYNKALKKVKEYETKLKRHTNILKKWKKKVKYYGGRRK